MSTIALRLQDGNAGDGAPVGDGVSEMRIHFGPGYRAYYVNRGGELILLLCGGNLLGKEPKTKDGRTAQECRMRPVLQSNKALQLKALVNA